MRDPTVPKSLHRVHGRPLIRYIVDACRAAGVDDRPVVLVGPGSESIRAELGQGHVYVEQGRSLGTGHALRRCRAALRASGAAHVLVLYGDKPLVSGPTVRALVRRHLQAPAAITMATVTLPDFAGPRAHLRGAGRILRGPDGGVLRIVEYADAGEQERRIAEINGGVYCFRADWLWRRIHRLGKANSQNEYYLTDLVAIAARERETISTLDIPIDEALGVNTPEDLARVAAVMAHETTAAVEGGRLVQVPEAVMALARVVSPPTPRTASARP
jgi:bifunctional UDP-N-acetylglucosamine pyrophosphorylase/glucosamine-1-phosphate N-acetyltransferase